MGGISSKAISRLISSKEVRILVLGLDDAGKSTTLVKLQLGDVITTLPTIGLQIEALEYKKTSFITWDLGGRNKIRPLVRFYYQNTNAIIFVLDSNDRERIGESAEELKKLLQEEELRDCALLVLANKQDKPNAMSITEITEKLGLHSLRNRTWYIQASCATSGEGLYEGLSWLSQQLKDQQLNKVVYPAEGDPKIVTKTTNKTKIPWNFWLT